MPDQNKEFDAALADLIRKGEPVQPIRENCEARAMLALRQVRPVQSFWLLHTIWEQRRPLAVAALAVLMVVFVFVIPRRNADSTLVDMTQAMANVQSASLTGIYFDDLTKQYIPVKGWVKGSGKKRLLIDKVIDSIDDGQRSFDISLHIPQEWPFVPPAVSFRIARYLTAVNILPSGAIGGQALNYLDFFQGPLLLSKLDLRDHQPQSRAVVLPNGRSAKVVEVKNPQTGAIDIFTIDTYTNLLVSWENRIRGKLAFKWEQIVYNRRIPDTVFSLQIPDGASVTDLTRNSQSSQRQQAAFAQWSATAEKIPGAIKLFPTFRPGEHGSCASPFHSRLRFEVLDNGGMIVVYLPDRNVYRIFGKVMVHTEGDLRESGHVADNQDFVAPSAAEIRAQDWKLAY
jgi:hypothetical protein